MNKEFSSRSLRSLCVFCGSSDRIAPEFIRAARSLGQAIADRGMRLVYGGGSTGLMGALAEGALERGGEVIGVIPEIFNTPSLAHAGLSQLIVVPDMHTRKARMIEMAQGFIALPGGYGTLEELFEVLTWAQVGIHRQPIGLLDVDGFFQPLLQLIRQLEEHGFIYTEHRSLLCLSAEPESLLEKMAAYRPPPNLNRWVDRQEEEQ
jgi:hypothetical protein